MSTSPSNSSTPSLQQQYENALNAANQAAQNQEQDTAAYYAQIKTIMGGGGSIEQKLYELMALISGDGSPNGTGNGGLQTQEDQVTTYSDQTNVNSALGQIVQDMTREAGYAYNSQPSGGGSGGMNYDEAGEFKNDWMNAVADVKAQMAAAKASGNNGAYQQGETMLNSLMDVQTQLGINIATSSPELIANTFDNLATNEANGNDTNPNGSGTASGPLSAINNDLTQVNTTLSSSSTTMNSMMQFVMSLIQELEPFVNDAFQELGSLDKAFTTNQIAQ